MLRSPIYRCPESVSRALPIPTAALPVPILGHLLVTITTEGPTVVGVKRIPSVGYWVNVVNLHGTTFLPRTVTEPTNLTRPSIPSFNISYEVPVTIAAIEFRRAFPLAAPNPLPSRQWNPALATLTIRGKGWGLDTPIPHRSSPRPPFALTASSNDIDVRLVRRRPCFAQAGIHSFPKLF